MNHYHLTTLKSGLRIVTVPMPAVESVTVLAMVGVGSRYEPKPVAGIAHFLEHLVFKGTKNYPEPTAISTTIDSVGGDYNAFTGKDYTGYYIKVASKHLDLALDVVSDMLLEPLIPDVEIEKEKGVIIEEINMHTDDPRWHISDVYDNVIYGDSALGRDIIGFKKTVKATTRKNIFDFLDSWYNLENVVLTIAGDESVVNDKEGIISQYFTKGKSRPGSGEKHHQVPTFNSPQVKLVHRATEQAHFYLGLPAIPRNHPDRFNLSILSTLLGGNSSARLFTEIREKRGLAYYAYCSSSSFADTGTIFAFEGVDPSRVEKAIQVTLEQFQAVTMQGLSLHGGVSDVEVTRAKDYLTGKLILDWEDSHSLAQTYARKLLLENKIETPEEILNKIKAVNLADVVKLAKKLFVPKKYNLALIGPFKDQGKFEKILTVQG